MSEGSDFTPVRWEGYDFGASAKKDYAKVVDNSMSDARRSNVSARDLVPDAIMTDSSAPLVIVSDVTGSMGTWPQEMFGKLGYLYVEAQNYLGKDMAISWCAVGDAYSDRYPLQVRGFSQEASVKEELEKLVIEGGGGGQSMETYELAALYYARNCSMPNAVRPVFIFIGDESPYDRISIATARDIARVNETRELATADVFAELQSKFEVFMVRKPYSMREPEDSTTRQVRERWEQILGPDRIATLGDSGRIVDVIFGILGQVTGKVDYFKDELKGRQTPAQVKTVMKALQTIQVMKPVTSDKSAAPADGKPAGKSKLRKDLTGSGKTKKLI